MTFDIWIFFEKHVKKIQDSLKILQENLVLCVKTSMCF